MCVYLSQCSVCTLSPNACLMSRGSSQFSGTRTAESYVDLVIAEALLHLIEEAAVCQLTEGRQVVVGSWRHQFDLREKQRKS